ncbi:hypothetical protein D3C83_250040 [compost metagenome]
MTGPSDIIGKEGIGVLDEDLGKAALAALDVPRARCRAYALAHGWRESAQQFLDNILLAQASRESAA